MDNTDSEWVANPSLQMQAFMDAISRESDRGCVICAAAYLDDALGSAIRSYLHSLSNPPKSILDALLSRRPQPPLGSFAVRTKMARALGLIDDRLMAAIDALRPMRNDSAHLGTAFSFDNYPIENMYSALSDEEQLKLKEMDALRAVNPEKYSKRIAFEAAMTSIFFRLVLIANNPILWSKVLRLPGVDARRMSPDGDPRESVKYYTDTTPITPELLDSMGFKHVKGRGQSSSPSPEDKDGTA